MHKNFNSAVNSALWGIGLIFGAIWFWHYLVGNPFDELELIRRAHTAPGAIVDAWEDAESGDEGGTHWSHGAMYKYWLPDGREFTQHTKEKPGRLRADLRDLSRPLPIEVEYLSDDPTVSRIKGDGSSNLFDWLWRKIGLGSVMLAFLAAPGITLLREAVRDVRRFSQKFNE